MPITLRDLRGLEGPNIYHGQPCVKFEVLADRDMRRLLADTIKTWAQQTGLVIGSLEQAIEPTSEGYVITTTFLTPFPLVAERMCEGVLADLEAAEQGNEDYSHDDLLFDVLRERKREEPGLPLLQLHAEARAHGLRLLPRQDKTVMVGTGKRGFIFDPAGLSLGLGVDIPWEQVGRVPLVAVTDTNGKTTTVRLISHIIASTGKVVGHTDTDGVYIGDEQVERGDWSGFDGSRRVLTDPQVDVAVLETARGGILRRGLAFNESDISVITNIAAEHLGELGINTIEQLARVKGVVALVAKPDGYVVLNADDPLVWGLREYVAAEVIAFSRYPDGPNAQEHQAGGGPLVYGDGTHVQVSIGETFGSFPLADVPITYGGTATHNVENVLAATAACVGLGLDIDTIHGAMRTFGTTASQNLGRLNTFHHAGATIILDYAHNAAGWQALLHFAERLMPHDGRIIGIIGGPGNRPNDDYREQARLIARVAQRMLIYEENEYLRGREPGEVPALYREGALMAGLRPDQITLHRGEVAAMQAALAELQAGDVVAAGMHDRQRELLTLLQSWSEN